MAGAYCGSLRGLRAGKSFAAFRAGEEEARDIGVRWVRREYWDSRGRGFSEIRGCSGIYHVQLLPNIRVFYIPNPAFFLAPFFSQNVLPGFISWFEHLSYGDIASSSRQAEIGITDMPFTMQTILMRSSPQEHLNSRLFSQASGSTIPLVSTLFSFLPPYLIVHQNVNIQFRQCRCRSSCARVGRIGPPISTSYGRQKDNMATATIAV
ncbi:hypothetical protein GYMLUDRAFT_563458 [Collybiopsis luxurians FD-317 M1]|uniref:Uncharacterized protein n=1 Tax=Collybiopsis luxurians FD-317 M1 TaxID=944289 RepID=A0A0D0BEA7_9AGAR|nr:hypothetical protein GYMLUDRAFT_563458 [Collybiopsis luxurians FD-317 M1]